MTSEKMQSCPVELSPVILAGGNSRRMGFAKPYMKIDDESFLKRIAGLLRRGGFSCPGVVVINERHRVLYDNLNLPDFEIVENARQELGQIYSLQLALSKIPVEASGLIMCLADHPLVSLETYQGLAKTHSTQPEKIIIPVYDNKKGHPLVLPRRYFSEVLELSPERPGGLRNLLDGHKADILKWHCQDPHILTDLDSPADWARVMGDGISPS